MEKILKDYIDIYKKFDKLVDKKFLAEKHKMFKEWSNAKYDSLPKSEELISFHEEYNEYFAGIFFYVKVLNPCIKEELKEGKILLLKYIFKLLADKEDGFVMYNALDCFCDSYKEYTVDDLGNIILEKDKDFVPVLKYKIENTDTFFKYTLQDVPNSIFYSGKITVETIKMFLEKLDTYESLCEKMNVDSKDDIFKYRNIFNAYLTFLKDKKQYGSFENTLNVLGVKY
ncbi:MAG: hypothetical protein ACK5LY_01845 [Lachnospirales bacterium]